ncbi:alpha/beta-hydrolase [Purpureocillium lavendulum]|uniref:Alpha/beta-hydrolase n=1 Tax=Purpureocillium lavendulum TaxID=1247861 RepID=A0AB34FC25_9HYPO|nr:alpha/beta-hydrolase [Purpureocillium lavendulum]
MAAQLTDLNHFSYSSLEPVATYVPRQTLSSQIRDKLQSPDTGRKKFHSRYDATIWMDATTTEVLERDFISLHQTIYHGQTLASVRPPSADAALIAVKAWFSRQQGSCLMVFDGADSVDDEQSSRYIDIQRFLPNAPKLHVIITSRSSSAMDMSPLRGVTVGRMEPQQAVELFLRNSRLSRTNPTVETDIMAIVTELGYVALAVAIAGTQIGRSPRLRSNIVGYLPENGDFGEILRQEPDKLGHAYGNSVHSMWEDVLGAVGNACPGAVTLMSILSFLHYDDIPTSLLRIPSGRTEGPVDGSDSASWRSKLPDNPLSDIRTLEICVQILERYSLVYWDENRKSYYVSKLVHSWTRSRLLPSERYPFSWAVLELIAEAVVACGPIPEDKQRLVPHVMANFRELSRLDTDPTDSLSLDGLETVGKFLMDSGRPKEARMVQTHLVEHRKRLLGAEDPKTLTATEFLALNLGDLGEFSRAQNLITEVVRCRQNTLGEDHPDTIGAVNNLVVILKGRGQYSDAIHLSNDLLKRCCQTLGEDHPVTVGVSGNLATLHGELGRLAWAIPLQEGVLEKRRKAYGEEHPKTLRADHRLAVLYGKDGQCPKSETILKRVVEKMKKTFGENHPETISALSSHADILAKLKRYDEVVPIRQDVLSKWQQVLGEEHPHTISALSILADTHADLGELDEAFTMATKVAVARTRILGENHLATIAAKHTQEAMHRRLELSGIAALPDTIVKRRKAGGGLGASSAQTPQIRSTWKIWKIFQTTK